MAVTRALATQSGSILAFLPGQSEVRRAMERLKERISDPAVVLAPPLWRDGQGGDELTELEVLDGHGRITAAGKRLRSLPLPPRLARMGLLQPGAATRRLAQPFHLPGEERDEEGVCLRLVVGYEHRPPVDTARNIAVHAEALERRQAGRCDPGKAEAEPDDQTAPVEWQGDGREHQLREEACDRAERDLEPRPE